jgi:Leucine-rich repeat (LRR) protein
MIKKNFITVYRLLGAALLAGLLFTHHSFAQARNEKDVSILQDIIDANDMASQVSTGTLGEQSWNQATGRLEALIINNYNLYSLPSSIGGLDSLKYLDLADNRLEVLPKSFWTLKNLQYLTLDNNEITALIDSGYIVINGEDVLTYYSIGALENLKQFSCNNNPLKSITYQILLLAPKLEYLSLINTGLTKLPAVPGAATFYLSGTQRALRFGYFSQFIKLKTLLLSQNSIDTLREEDFAYTYKMDSLIQLDLDSNRITQLPASLGSLPAMQALSAAHNQLETVPPALGNSQNLYQVSLDSNKISSLPGELFNAPGLGVITASYNNLASLPAELVNAKKLVALDISNNQLVSLPAGMNIMDSLYLLKASDNSLTTLPENFCSIPNLGVLDLSHNSINQLPENFGSLKMLTVLLLNNNRLSELPESFGNLQNLFTLYLNNNAIQALPETFGNIDSSVVSLNLQNNRLKYLPQNFGNMVNLKELILDNNNLDSLPSSFGQLVNLNSVNLTYNRLKTLPESFGSLKSNIIYLTNNSIDSLPQSFGGLDVSFLDLSYNELEKLPDSFSDLDTLFVCNLSYNKFTNFPMQIAGLKYPLAYLNLSHNYLSYLPDTLQYIPVAELDITGNDLWCVDGLQDIANIPAYLTDEDDETYPVEIVGLNSQSCATPSKVVRPGTYALYTPYPNPFNFATVVNFSIPEQADVQILLYDTVGRKVKEITNKSYTKGYYRLFWTADNLASGTYFLQMICRGFTQTQKVMLIK